MWGKETDRDADLQASAAKGDVFCSDRKEWACTVAGRNKWTH